MPNDVEMTDASASTKPAAVNGVPEKKESAVLTVADLKKNVQMIEKTVDSKEIRFITSVLRQTTSIRKKLNDKVLYQIISFVFPESESTKKKFLLSFVKVNNDMDVDSKETGTTKSLTPEVEAYLHLLVLIYLIDQKQYEAATKCSTALIGNTHQNNRITFYPLTSKIFFYYSLSFELVDKLEEIRPTLLTALRTATLRHNDEGQATILNLLLRNYLEYNLIEQADNLVNNTQFPEQTASSNQFARYLYYQGRIKSIQLEYAESYKFLTQAIRKAPQNTATGFKRTVYKLLCIVQLLMGEIPERSIFSQKNLRASLKPYLILTQTVRVGDLVSFHKVQEQYCQLFKEDKTFSLIQRLRTSVIKAGLKKINAAYSRISFDDIVTKLKFDGNPQDMMFIVAKTIKDGVIDATINFEQGYLQSKENIDAYSTFEPTNALSNRIDICLKIHNDSLKAMRFHPDLNREETEKIAEESKNIKQELERQVEESSDGGEDGDF
ncbi:26S proteasome regulatory subunit S3 [Tieghemostelium lacteum]|uniref:26S proteasome regulatory subunit S3 n=1 Tax=Tieghemostelium lacteum TaxID=361077 RepID=A0A151ZHB8_TIELA|nr:26S proteasome regulatory subunit S3 [Tieghemostelium lacteum]|eukprot:KYQ93363.1 26S proteasome regulatory subunit S3 [Tieghemostelium lacteum]